MGRRRGLALVAVVCALVVVLAAIAVVTVARVEHPRDERAFLRVVAHGSAHGGASRGVNNRFLIADGDRACDWLRGQPPALWRRGGRWSFHSLRVRYDTREVPRSSRGPRFDRDAVAVEAWAHLCGSDYYLRETHNPFTSPHSD